MLGHFTTNIMDPNEFNEENVIPGDSLDMIKLRALREGIFTDCAFLVGPDDGPQEVR
jgi:hypothetical protein